MAKQLSYIIIDQFMSDSSGDLMVSGHQLRYVVEDTVDPELKKAGTLELNDIVAEDTVSEWWAKVQQQVEDEEGIT